MDQNPWIPESAKDGLANNSRQRQYLLLADVNEVFYGGAAGGGKTFASLIAAAQFVDVPGYSALLLRENFADLNQPQAWIALSKSWWYGKGPAWNSSDHRWTFPSGATITFGYLEGDSAVYQYDSAAYQFIGIDELTQHTEWRYRFMFGRLRRPAGAGQLAHVPLRMRSGSNPGNKGHDWVKRRFVDPATREPGAVFVPAKLDDNSGNLDVESYKRDSLSKLDPITRAQREHGDWNATTGGRFRREWFAFFRRQGDHVVIVDGGRHLIYERGSYLIFMTVDPAASSKTTADYTVISTWGWTRDAKLLWLDCVRVQLDIPDIVPVIQKQCVRWQPACVRIESVAANSAVFQLAQRAINPAIPAFPVSPKGQDKLIHASGAIAFAAGGRIYLPGDSASFPLDDVLGELTRFTGNDKVDANDDVVDTLSLAVDYVSGDPLGSEGAGAVPKAWG